MFTALRKDAPVPPSIDRDFQRILGGGLPGGIDYYSESIDVARFPDDGLSGGAARLPQRNYHGRRFDLVVAVSEACLTFVDNNREALFPDAPVVFIAAPARGAARQLDGGVHGPRPERHDCACEQLQPDAHQVFVVSGASDYDRFYENLARTQLDAFRKNLAFTYLSGLPIADLERRLSTLPPRSLVYYLVSRRTARVGTFSRSSLSIALPRPRMRRSTAFMEIWMDHGIVGGSLLSLSSPVRSAADRALRVLRGESADSIPTPEIDPHVNQVDWRQLRRWEISESRVPAGTSIRFREPGPGTATSTTSSAQRRCCSCKPFSSPACSFSDDTTTEPRRASSGAKPSFTPATPGYATSRAV